jgi:hypothetical protein
MSRIGMGGTTSRRSSKLISGMNSGKRSRNRMAEGEEWEGQRAALSERRAVAAQRIGNDERSCHPFRPLLRGRGQRSALSLPLNFPKPDRTPGGLSPVP